jgi:hypothetical protein
MMHAIDDETLRTALEVRGDGTRIGEALVGMQVITTRQLERALEWQSRMRAAKSVEEVADLLDEVAAQERRQRAALFEAIPPTNPGVTT